MSAQLQSLPVDGSMHLVDGTGRTVCGIVLAGRTAGPWPFTPCTVCDVQAGVVNERRVRVRSRFVYRWDAILTVVVAFVVGIVIGMGVQFAIDHAAPADQQASVPWCTAPIADAGGICHGEPLEACVTEDSANCYWDARGTGRSFVDVDGVVYFQDIR